MAQQAPLHRLQGVERSRRGRNQAREARGQVLIADIEREHGQGIFRLGQVR